MKTRGSCTYISVLFFYTLLGVITGCKKDANTDAWTETNDIEMIAYKSNPENGKQYLNVIYENVGRDTLRKIKYQLFMRTGTKTDTIEKTIIPETVVLPKDKRLVPKNIGEEPALWDEVKVGKIWTAK